MFLKEITLTNFKCHKSLWINFSCNEKNKLVRKTTFLLGENGTGKSAVLKAIAIITSGSNGLGDIIGNPNDWIKNNEKFCEIKATIVTARAEEREIRLRIVRGQSLREIISFNYETLGKIDEAIKKADRNYFVVGYGASRRLNRGEEMFSNISNRFSSPRSINIQTLFNPDAILVSLANWAMELDYSKSNAGLSIVKKALNNFLVDNVRFKAIDKKRRTLNFETPDGIIPLEQLSDGYQNVAAWVGDLMYNITKTFKDYKEPLKARGLLLIDEIDLHLHPKWQRLLHQFLKEKLPNFQVIGTSHSPLTAQQAEEGELYALKREKGKVLLIPFEGSPSKLLIHQILMSPVFGLETDESLVVENAKEKVRSIELKDNPTKKEIDSLAPYKDILSESNINLRSNTLLSTQDITLLQQINSQLSQEKIAKVSSVTQRKIPNRNKKRTQQKLTSSVKEVKKAKTAISMRKKPLRNR